MPQATQEQTRMDRLSSGLPSEELHRWLYSMQLIREFESRTMQAYQQAKIGGFCHIYTGQEACAVGTIACLRHDDPVVTAYRDHGHALARGMHPAACMAEMFGKLQGCAKGKGGSMHMFDRPNHLYGGHGIVGAQTPLGAGLAFAAKYRAEVLGAGERGVALCYLGDGALGQGAVYEALNLASIYDLPVIYVIENNGYSMGTALHRHAGRADDLTLRGEAFGVRGERIDGLDILDVYDRFKPLVDWVRSESRPLLVDFKTYRYQGHSMSDPQKYRTKEEVDQFKERDSIAALVSHLMTPKADGGRGSLTEDDWQALQQQIRAVVRDAVEFAEHADAAPLDELTTDVYALPMKNLSPQTTYEHGVKNPLT